MYFQRLDVSAYSPRLGGETLKTGRSSKSGATALLRGPARRTRRAAARA
jgi:hypothetical protein